MSLPVTLGHTLDLILLLDRVTAHSPFCVSASALTKLQRAPGWSIKANGGSGQILAAANALIYHSW